jgi:ArsR family transcriptional regulator, arsenate/arsenite/antimonite-responsive transcriptional repressor
MKELTAIFKALSDETRIRIVKLLEKGELCVCDIVAALDIVQPKASFHLGVLWKAGLIKDRKQGKWIHYSLNESDLFKRMLMVSVCEKADGKVAAADQKRLERFLKSKESGPGCATKTTKSKACACGA